jgi:hypothetical protein
MLLNQFVGAHFARWSAKKESVSTNGAAICCRTTVARADSILLSVRALTTTSRSGGGTRVEATDMVITKEETLGPVPPLYRFNTGAEAIKDGQRHRIRPPAYSPKRSDSTERKSTSSLSTEHTGA